MLRMKLRPPEGQRDARRVWEARNAFVFSVGKSKPVLFGLSQGWSGMGGVHPVGPSPAWGSETPKPGIPWELGCFPGQWVLWLCPGG